ncbi:Fumarate reductase flavoprotein subunit [Lactobacillus delbrueckii subsp. bulgaricus]|uniref:FMN-binding protein n=1 Tax=Lactobacillus delbrueckii TaxID=1584 RepID=UPI000B5CEA2D|nr:FMN-binding protein [Lactobacillus delbrueckii]AXI14883.1 Fumarate reductase flavoprotein subunit [Lactobacillus delbrueckii subsp. bulgaricus]MCD5456946.1 FMN-binding protein [Lactobacillus delbrueckii subsp. bulgaricus]MCD5479341.1 FMN-binding protein [Lactobacillus delbrueckii subsp. bulgaricus]MCT3516677.1 FMN-binding protein [Lactobacillus delbrueckii subsp. bulgaricus]MCT3519156.1 FMN-binding protein [Lactobacillus delbrueckii subsp. bulgaricus]
MYKKGDYEVEAEGHHSTVKLRVSFDEEKLTKIEVLEENETQAFVDDLKDRFIPEVVANQSLNVDAISGATKLAKAVTSSVEEAITEAGGDPKTFIEAAHVAKDDQVIPGMYVVGTDYSPYYDIPGFCYGSCIGSGVIAGHEASAYAKA